MTFCFALIFSTSAFAAEKVKAAHAPEVEKVKDTKDVEHLKNKQIQVSVKGMVCAFCAQGVTKKLKAESAVEKVDVSLEKKLVTIDFKEGKDLSDEAIKTILTDSGYSVDKIDRGVK